jgi:hypothetical protein
MPITKKRCEFCHDWFTPDARTKHQVSCNKPECRRLRKQAANQRWRRNNSSYDKSRAAKKRAWAKKRNYWHHYRETRPAYAAADNKRRHKDHKALKSAANQDARREIAVGKLADTRVFAPDSAANQDAIARRVDILVEYLFLNVPAANPNDTDQSLSGGP